MEDYIYLFDHLNDHEHDKCKVDSKQLGILIEVMRNRHTELRRLSKTNEAVKCFNIQQRLESLSFKDNSIVSLKLKRKEYQYLKEELLISINWTYYN